MDWVGRVGPASTSDLASGAGQVHGASEGGDDAARLRGEASGRDEVFSYLVPWPGGQPDDWPPNAPQEALANAILCHVFTVL